MTKVPLSPLLSPPLPDVQVPDLLPLPQCLYRVGLGRGRRLGSGARRLLLLVLLGVLLVGRMGRMWSVLY